MTDSESPEHEDLPMKIVKHYVGARLINVRHRDSLSNWSAVFSFGSVLGSLYMAYVGWSTCGYYSLFVRLVRGYDGSFIPWFAGFIGTMMATIFLAGTLLCTISATTYLRVRMYYMINVYLYALLACLVTLILSAVLTGLHVTLLSSSSKGSLMDSLSRYNNDTTIRQSIDRLQIELKCCGSVSYVDWWNTEWYSLEYINRNSPQIAEIVIVLLPTKTWFYCTYYSNKTIKVQEKMHGNKFLTDDVPFSCCNPEALRPCVHHAMKDPKLHHNYVLTEVTVYTMGCSDALNAYFTRAIVLQVTFATISTLLTLVPLLIIFRYMQTSTMTSIAEDEPYEPARGYLWIRREHVRPKSHGTDKKDRKKKKKEKTKDKSKKNKQKKDKIKKTKKKGSDKKRAKTDSGESSTSDSSDSSDTSGHKSDKSEVSKRQHKLKSGYSASVKKDPISVYEQSQNYPSNQQGSALYSPYASTADAYSKYYADYYQSLVSQQPNNNDPKDKFDAGKEVLTGTTVVKEAPSVDIYDVIDDGPSQHEGRAKKDTSIRDEIHHSHKQLQKVKHLSGGQKDIKSTSLTRKQPPQQVPSDDIYDEVEPVQSAPLQSAKAAPKPPPMRRQQNAKQNVENKSHHQTVEIIPSDDLYDEIEPVQSAPARSSKVVPNPPPMRRQQNAKQNVEHKSHHQPAEVIPSDDIYDEIEPVQSAPVRSAKVVPKPPPMRRQQDAKQAITGKSNLSNDTAKTSESVYLEPHEVTNVKTKTIDKHYQNLPDATRKSSRVMDESEYLLPQTESAHSEAPLIDKTPQIGQEAEYLLPQLPPESEYLMPQLPPESEYLMPQLPPESEYLMPQVSSGLMKQSTTYANIDHLATANVKRQATNDSTYMKPIISKNFISKREAKGNSSIRQRNDQSEAVYLEPRIVFNDRTSNTDSAGKIKSATKADHREKTPDARRQPIKDRTVPPAPPPLRKSQSFEKESVRTASTNMASSTTSNSIYEPLRNSRSVAENSLYQPLQVAGSVAAQPSGIYEPLRSTAVNHQQSSVGNTVYEKLQKKPTAVYANTKAPT